MIFKIKFLLCSVLLSTLLGCPPPDCNQQCVDNGHESGIYDGATRRCLCYPSNTFMDPEN